MLRNRVAFALAAVIAVGGPARAASWAEALFEETSKDFGPVARGPTLTHDFRVVNRSDKPVHIAGVRVSCGCVTAWALKNDVAPGKETAIHAQMDTRRFTGPKTVTVFVQLDRPEWQEVRLTVSANGRDDVSITPSAFDFGHVRHGSSSAGTVTVLLLGRGARVTGARCESNCVEATVQEKRRGEGDVAYEVTARLRPETPVGRWYTDVWVNTTDPTAPRLRVPLTVEVGSALTVSPAVAALGEIKAGAAAEKKVIVRGTKPFRITAVQGTDASLTVKDNSADAKPVHVLTVKLKAAKPGDVARKVQVRTDLKDEGMVEFEATAKVVP